MADAAQPTCLGGATLQQGYGHVCAFFSTPEEEDRLLHPFFAEGIERGEKCIYIVEEADREDHLARLAAAGMDVARLLESGQLVVRASTHHYILGGYFDKDRALVQISAALDDARAQGYPLTRVVGRTSWSRSGLPGVEDLLEYEIRLNEILPRYDDPVVCVYDSTRLGAAEALDILRTHPVVILSGIARTNPFFTPPDEFLRELRERDESERWSRSPPRR